MFLIVAQSKVKHWKLKSLKRKHWKTKHWTKKHWIEAFARLQLLTRFKWKMTRVFFYFNNSPFRMSSICEKHLLAARKRPEIPFSPFRKKNASAMERKKRFVVAHFTIQLIKSDSGEEVRKKIYFFVACCSRRKNSTTRTGFANGWAFDQNSN